MESSLLEKKHKSKTGRCVVRLLIVNMSTDLFIHIEYMCVLGASLRESPSAIEEKYRQCFFLFTCDQGIFWRCAGRVIKTKGNHVVTNRDPYIVQYIGIFYNKIGCVRHWKTTYQLQFTRSWQSEVCSTSLARLHRWNTSDYANYWSCTWPAW